MKDYLKDKLDDIEVGQSIRVRLNDGKEIGGDYLGETEDFLEVQVGTTDFAGETLPLRRYIAVEKIRDVKSAR